MSNNYISYSHAHSISTTVPVTREVWLDAMTRYPQQYTPKEPTMTPAQKIAAERKEAREKRRVETLYEGYDEGEVDGWEDGTHCTFAWKTKDKTYAYAAIKADGVWYVTGRESPNGLATEDFVAWLIDKDIAFETIMWWDP